MTSSIAPNTTSDTPENVRVVPKKKIAIDDVGDNFPTYPGVDG